MAVFGRVETANNWVLLELRALWSSGTWGGGGALQKGRAAVVLQEAAGVEGQQAVPMTGFQTLPLLWVAGVVTVV